MVPPPALATMVGKRVRSNGIGSPEPREGKHRTEMYWALGMTYESRQVGKKGVFILEDYDERGILISSGEDHEWPLVIARGAVLSVELLPG